MHRPEVGAFIEMYDMCQAFQCLPRAGGLFDQDPYHLYGMGLVAAARAEQEKHKAAMQGVRKH